MTDKKEDNNWLWKIISFSWLVMLTIFCIAVSFDVEKNKSKDEKNYQLLRDKNCEIILFNACLKETNQSNQQRPDLTIVSCQKSVESICLLNLNENNKSIISKKKILYSM